MLDRFTVVWSYVLFLVAWTERVQLFVRYTMERPRFSDHLEAIKFICKDFWSELFKKQIDNLKTNHRVSSVLIFFLGFKCGTDIGT